MAKSPGVPENYLAPLKRPFTEVNVQIITYIHICSISTFQSSQRDVNLNLFVILNTKLIFSTYTKILMSF